MSGAILSDTFEHSLLQRAAAGDGEAWRTLVQRFHDRLRRMVALRLDQRLAARIDPSDVLQDVYLQATDQLQDYLRHPNQPFFLWLRLLTGNRLARLHRYHIGTQARDATREISYFGSALPEASSAALAAQLLGQDPSLVDGAILGEQLALVQRALSELDLFDRETIALRHFEQLSTAEAAQVLGISVVAAAKRYLRAVGRLKQKLSRLPGGLEGFSP